MNSRVRQHHADDTDLQDILELIQSSFAYMDSRINPPSSMHRLRIANIADQCRSGEVWSMGNPIQACMVLKLKPDALYLGRLSIRQEIQGRGLGKQMVEHAINRAQQLGKAFVEIETRVELFENHAFFSALGFTTIATHSHDGYDQPTYITMRRPVTL